MEYAASGSLVDQSQSSKFNDREGRTIIYQTLDGLTYLHEQGVIHRDLKPGNILVKTRQPMHIKVADFGISTKLSEEHNTLCGTHLYAAPEIWTPPYTEKIDVWSVGIIVLELWAGLPKYNRDTWAQEVLSRKATTSRAVMDFLDHLLQLDPSERSSARRCLGLPFVTRSGRLNQTAHLDLHPLNSETKWAEKDAHGHVARLDDGVLPDTAIPDTAIWHPVEHEESPLGDDGLDSAPGTVFFSRPPHNSNYSIPTWNPINPDSWIPGGVPSGTEPAPASTSASEGLSADGLSTAEIEPASGADAGAETEHGAQQQKAAKPVLRKPPSYPVPEKPHVEGKYEFLLYGNTWVAHDTESGTVNVTQILKGVRLHRANLQTPTVKGLVAARKQIVRGKSSIKGTFLPYRDAVLVCGRLRIEAGFLNALLV